MGNYGQLTTYVYNLSKVRVYDDGASGLTTTPNANGVLYPLGARGKDYLMGIGYGKLYFHPGDEENYPLIQTGVIMTAFINDSIAGGNLVVCDPFLVRNIHIIVRNEIPVLEVSGPLITQELADVPIFQTIATRGSIETTTTVNKGGQGENETEIEVADASNVADGDDIIIPIGDPAQGYTSALKIYRGTVNGAPSIGTGIGGNDVVTIDPPLNDFVASGTTVTFVDYHSPTTEDVRDILNYMNAPAAAGEWTLSSGTGSTAGTSHAATGGSAFDLLTDTANITGEWWRLTKRTSASDAPLRKIDWRSSKDASGVTLLMPTQANAVTQVTSTAHGIIEKFTREHDDQRVSHVIPFGGGGTEDAISLSDASNSASTGFTLQPWLGYGFATLQHDSVASDLSPTKRSAVVSFGSIRPDGPSEAAINQAGNQLLDAAENWLDARSEKLRFYAITCVVHKDLEIGQSIAFEWSDGYLDLDIATLYITEYEREVGDDGVLRYHLICGETLVPRIDGPTLLAATIKNMSGVTKGINAIALGSSVIPTISGSAHLPVTIAASTPTGGLTVDGSQALTLNVPGTNPPDTLDTTTTNSTAGSVHTHAITNTADGETNPSTILSSDSNGALRVARLGVGEAAPPADDVLYVANISSSGAQSINPVGNLTIVPTGGLVNILTNVDIDGDLEFQGAQSISTTADDLTLAPADDLLLDPTGDGSGIVRIMNANEIQEDSFTEGFLGNSWRITGAGVAEFRKVIADELHVTHFTFEHAVATGRSQWITPGASKLTRDFTIPSAIAGTATIYVEDIPGAAGVQVFPTDSWVLLRYFTHDYAEGHLDLFNVWGQVSAFTDIANSSEQSYTFTLRAGIDYETDADDSHPRSKTIERGAPAIGFGSSGSGWISLTAGDAAEDSATPNIAVRTWAGANPYESGNRTLHTLVGQLSGVTSTDEYGIYAGEGVATDDAHFIFSDNTILINNIPIVMESGGVSKIKIDPDVPSLAIGGTLMTGYNTGSGGEGLWVGNDSGTYKLFIGEQGGRSLRWDGTDLNFVDGGENVVISLKSDGNSEFSGTMTIATSGEIVATNTIIDEDGVFISDIGSSIGFGTKEARSGSIKFGNTSTDPDSYIALVNNVDNLSLNIAADNPSTTAGKDSDILLEAIANGTTQVTAELHGDTGDSTTNSYFTVGIRGSEIFRVYADGIRTYNDKWIYSDGYLLADTYVQAPQMIADQGASDNEVALFKSSDVSHGISVGTDITTATFGSLSKEDAAYGGLSIRGLADTNEIVGLGLRGFVITTSATKSTSALGAVTLSAYAGTTPTNIGASNNAIVFRSGSTARWIMQGDGGVYMDSVDNESNFDEYDDMHLIRAAQGAIGGGLIQSQWDKFVQYNRDDLDRMDIVTKSGFINQQNITKLIMGALWQAHQRIAKLESGVT